MMHEVIALDSALFGPVHPNLASHLENLGLIYFTSPFYDSNTAAYWCGASTWRPCRWPVGSCAWLKRRTQMENSVRAPAAIQSPRPASASSSS